jgi:hypothetical protein
VCLIALIGGMPTDTTALYGTGLDFSSVFPRLSRVQATVLVGAVAIAFSFVGRFGLNVALLRLFPEPRAVYGPEGARPARTVDVPVPPITGPGARGPLPDPPVTSRA